MIVSLPQLFCSNHNWGGELPWGIFVLRHLRWDRILHMCKVHIIVVRNADHISHFTVYAMNVGSGSCQGFKACTFINLGAFFTFSCLLYLRFSLKFAIHNTPDTFEVGAKSCLQSSACFNNTGKNVAMIIQNNSCRGCYSCAQNEKGIFTGFSHHHFFEAKLISTLIHFK